MARAAESAKVAACGGVLLSLALALGFGVSAYQMEEVVVGWLLFSAAFLLLSSFVFATVGGFLLVVQVTKWAAQQVHAFLEAASSSPTIHSKGLH